MNRRKSIHTLAAASAAAMFPLEAAPVNAIQLHVDLEVDPAKEKTLVATFKSTFEPTIRKQKGFVDVKLLKFRQDMTGKPPGRFNYRLLISFQTEELRQQWVASADHQRVWPEMEKNLTGQKYVPLLYDIA
jgi:heme-degrading monooxygenase HmoA